MHGRHVFIVLCLHADLEMQFGTSRVFTSRIVQQFHVISIQLEDSGHGIEEVFTVDVRPFPWLNTHAQININKVVAVLQRAATSVAGGSLQVIVALVLLLTVLVELLSLRDGLAGLHAAVRAVSPRSIRTLRIAAHRLVEATGLLARALLHIFGVHRGVGVQRAHALPQLRTSGCVRGLIAVAQSTALSGGDHLILCAALSSYRSRRSLTPGRIDQSGLVLLGTVLIGIKLLVVAVALRKANLRILSIEYDVIASHEIRSQDHGTTLFSEPNTHIIQTIAYIIHVIRDGHLDIDDGASRVGGHRKILRIEVKCGVSSGSSSNCTRSLQAEDQSRKLCQLLWSELPVLRLKIQSGYFLNRIHERPQRR
mmetsp:Transcript_19507/g.39358  ORF Transcript_19507/g.39358 Transcript_19507/m.39358 type:complete len:367 (+) Transcript_19507:689-1789(+)